MIRKVVAVITMLAIFTGSALAAGGGGGAGGGAPSALYESSQPHPQFSQQKLGGSIESQPSSRPESTAARPASIKNPKNPASAS